MLKSIRVLMVSVLAVGIGVGPGLRDDSPYDQIEDGLFLGPSVGQPPPGTRAVVNVCGLKDPYPVEAVLWDPVLEEGSAPPTLDWLRRTVEFVAAQRRAKRTTYVHCMAGVNRSAAVVTAVLMAEHGWSRDEALAHLRGKRPAVQPDPTLMKLLADWERR